MDERAAGNADALRGDGGQAEPVGDGVDLLLRRIGADPEHHFVRHVTRFAYHWHAGEAALAGQRPKRQPGLCQHDRRAVLLVDPAIVGCGHREEIAALAGEHAASRPVHDGLGRRGMEGRRPHAFG
jgi:hypothetical protein